MGDCRMAEIKTEGGSLYLYTHWHGSALPEMAKAAVTAARPRLSDPSHWVRIVIDQLTKPGRDQMAGWGIMLAPNEEDEYNDDKPSVIIDGATGTVTIVGRPPTLPGDDEVTG